MTDNNNKRFFKAVFPKGKKENGNKTWEFMLKIDRGRKRKLNFGRFNVFFLWINGRNNCFSKFALL